MKFFILEFKSSHFPSKIDKESKTMKLTYK